MSGLDVFFVDSNVLLYYVDPSDRMKRAQATDWLDQLWLTGRGRLSWQVLHEFYWNAIRKMRLDPMEARRIVESLWHWRPVDMSPGLVKDSWTLIDTAGLSYWDALIVTAAQRSGSRFLLSEDLQAGQIFGDVQVLHPFKNSPAKFLQGN